MASIFNQELSFWKKVNKATDMVILNVLFLICCIPVVTIGPAYSALYYSVVKSVRKNRGYAAKNFFHSFLQNLKQGIPSTVIFLGIYLLAYGAIRNVWKAALVSESARFTFWIAVVAVLFITCVLTYFFAVLSRFNFSFKNLFVFTLLITFKHFLTTICLLGILILLGVVCYLCIPIFLVFGVALYVYLSSFFVEKIFLKYMPKFEKAKPAPVENEDGSFEEMENEELTPEEAELLDKDQWYYE